MRFNIAGSWGYEDGHNIVTLDCLPANYKQYFCVGLLIFEKKLFELRKNKRYHNTRKDFSTMFNMLNHAKQQLHQLVNSIQKNPNAWTRRGLFDSREPGRTRTCDRLLRRQMLYPAELRVQTHRVRRRSCREDRTRTCDPLVPNQMRYHLRHFPNLLMNFSSRKDWDSNPGDAIATTA